jgi:tRNA(Arg) A34 adenosine deaminase TadA
MKVRFFKFARAASKQATYQGSHRFSPMIGAVAVYKGSIVATACNSNKTSPLQAKYNVYRFNADTPDKAHCETILIQKLRWKFGDSIDWSKVHIYLYREYKNGSLGPSRPCSSCMIMLKDLGIKRIAYTTEDGYAEEKFK